MTPDDWVWVWLLLLITLSTDNSSSGNSVDIRMVKILSPQYLGLFSHLFKYKNSIKFSTCQVLNNI